MQRRNVKVRALARLTFDELRDRLVAQADYCDQKDRIDIYEAARYLMALPDDRHTALSVDALLAVARQLHSAAEPEQTLQAGLRVDHLASALGDQVLLYGAKMMQGVAHNNLGNFAQAAVAHIEAWSIARDLKDTRREAIATLNYATVCAAMGQYATSALYHQRCLELAEECGCADLALVARANLADCAVKQRDPDLGFRVVSELIAIQAKTRNATQGLANSYTTLARLHLLTNDVSAARACAKEAKDLARMAGSERAQNYAVAVGGLIAALAGAKKAGLSALERSLSFANRVARAEVPNFLDMCIEGYEAAGQTDVALTRLTELIAWKRKLIEASIAPLDPRDDPTERADVNQTIVSNLLAKADVLEIGLQSRFSPLIATAVNAGIAAGHDLYRTFRLAALSRHLATEIGWSQLRASQVSIAAQLCDVGMIAVPAHVLQKPTQLSSDECLMLQAHARYGAELLRKTKLSVLDAASLVAEQHHEQFDGNGYPLGLRGEEITPEARLVAVCDAFDSMTHSHPSRPQPIAVCTALAELEQRVGSCFDPLFVRSFSKLIRSKLSRQKDLDGFLAEGAEQFEYVRARIRAEAFLRTGAIVRQ